MPLGLERLLANSTASLRGCGARPAVAPIGAVAWIVAEGVLTRRDASGEETVTPYLVGCIFEQVEGEWRWRQFFGSEPA